ncbi:MAG: hypothetical protein JWL91_333 [Sphingomonas bacterium]|nr:hypothetical protein [Sphingomonas bacterium]
MTVHGENHRAICPVCLRVYDDPDRVAAHMKSSRSMAHREHRAAARTEGDREKRELERRYRSWRDGTPVGDLRGAAR